MIKTEKILQILFFIFSSSLLANNILYSQTQNDQWAIKIKKSEIGSVAKFYPYKAGNVKMELFAVKASDGTIRTALNTCQVCYDSGRGYYIQKDNLLICQNCGSRFQINNIEVIKGGCNPVPILKDNKKETNNYIYISKEYLSSVSGYFYRWGK